MYTNLTKPVLFSSFYIDFQEGIMYNYYRYFYRNYFEIKIKGETQ